MTTFTEGQLVVMRHECREGIPAECWGGVVEEVSEVYATHAVVLWDDDYLNEHFGYCHVNWLEDYNSKDEQIRRLQDQVAHLSTLHRAEGTFDVDLPCPQCGEHLLFGYYFLTPELQHMHTYYVCRNWPSGDRGANLAYVPTERCGWHGWTVPSNTRSGT